MCYLPFGTAIFLKITAAQKLILNKDSVPNVIEVRRKENNLQAYFLLINNNLGDIHKYHELLRVKNNLSYPNN